MLIIGCDFHTRYQQIAMMDETTGELIERRLDHESGEAHAFYREAAGLNVTLTVQLAPDPKEEPQVVADCAKLF